MHARDVVERVIRTYAEARYYSDRGRVVRHILDGTRVEIPFRTSFERGGPFELTFSIVYFAPGLDGVQADGFRVVARDGRATAFWGDGRADVDVPIANAVGRVTGMSFGAAVLVPNLLMPDDVKARPLFEPLAETSLCEPELLEGARHDVVSVRTTSRRVFVSPEGLIRRMDETEGERAVWSIDYQPILTV